MITYGQTISWTGKDRSVTSVTVNGRSSAKEALKDAITEAKHFGWAYPKWYQWWRKRDTKPDLSLIGE